MTEFSKLAQGAVKMAGASDELAPRTREFSMRGEVDEGSSIGVDEDDSGAVDYDFSGEVEDDFSGEVDEDLSSDPEADFTRDPAEVASDVQIEELKAVQPSRPGKPPRRS